MRDIDAIKERLSTEIYEAVMDWSDSTDRSQQQAANRVGVSDLGFCSEKVRRMLLREEPTSRPDKLAAFIGTWLGGGVETAIKARWPDVVTQSEVEVELDTDEGKFVISGHPDILLPDEGIVLDAKTVDGFAQVTSFRKFEEDQQKKFQRHLYGLGAFNAGMLNVDSLDDVLVGNLWIDRSGGEHHFMVDLEPFSQEVVDHAGSWLSEVAYSFKHDQEARKEPPRTFCENWCEYFSTCRALDSDVEGVIDDPLAPQAVSLYQEGAAMVREGKKLQDGAKKALEGLSGAAGGYLVRWVEVQPSVVPETVRRGYTKLSLTKMKEPKNV